MHIRILLIVYYIGTVLGNCDGLNGFGGYSSVSGLTGFHCITCVQLCLRTYLYCVDTCITHYSHQMFMCGMYSFYSVCCSEGERTSATTHTLKCCHAHSSAAPPTLKHYSMCVYSTQWCSLPLSWFTALVPD